jgi:hypothetical protein
MPAERKEQIRKLPSGRWQLRYYDREGVRHSGGAFPSKSAARGHYRDVIEPQLTGRKVTRADITFEKHVDRYLVAHATGRDASTIKTLTHRLGYATAEFGDLTLEALERAYLRSPRGPAPSRQGPSTGSSRRSARRSRPRCGGGT